jgi:N-acetylglutamate synthase-like GNAT family acetyltransferase
VNRADLRVRPIEPQDRAWILETVRTWGDTDYIVSRGRVIKLAELPGFCAVGPSGEPLGLATYEVVGSKCQVVTLHALRRFAGIGTALLAAVREAAVAHSCDRLWAITTNDNLTLRCASTSVETCTWWPCIVISGR